MNYEGRSCLNYLRVVCTLWSCCKIDAVMPPRIEFRKQKQGRTFKFDKVLTILQNGSNLATVLKLKYVLHSFFNDFIFYLCSKLDLWKIRFEIFVKSISYTKLKVLPSFCFPNAITQKRDRIYYKKLYQIDALLHLSQNFWVWRATYLQRIKKQNFIIQL